MPSAVEICLSLNNMMNNKVPAARNMVVYLSMSDLIFTGPIIAAIPTVMQILNRLLPITLPMAILPEPVRDKQILVSRAGVLIPKAIIVSPVTNGDIPAFKASAVAPFSRYDAPK